MDTLIVEGPQRLVGEIEINGAKNGSLPLMVCALITEDDLHLSNMPILTDVYIMIELLQNYGARVNFDPITRKIVINCGELNSFNAPYSITGKMRASIWTLAPVLAKFGRAEIALPGGCNLSASGTRQIDLHTSLLEQMGATITYKDGYIHASIDGKFKAVNFHFAKVSVGATINGILAAVLADGISLLNNCAVEPEITDMCNCLTKMGAKIEGIGTRALRIHGSKSLKGATHSVIPDRIEAGTYLIMAAITGGQVKVNGINKALLENLCTTLQLVGNEIRFDDNSIFLKASEIFKSVDISTEPFPGFVTDLQAQFMSLMCLASGTSYISENIYDNRFTHVPELNKMGADISIQGRTAKVVGVNKLSGSSVYASDLRASVCLVLAGLAAHGTTVINNAHQLNRGYEKLIHKLAKCGVQIYSTSATNASIVA